LKEKNRVLNNDIQAKTVQIITDDGENLGEMSMQDARVKAAELGLDLMEM
jgi:translation initiation factor IF-3